MPSSKKSQEAIAELHALFGTAPPALVQKDSDEMLMEPPRMEDLGGDDNDGTQMAHGANKPHFASASSVFLNRRSSADNGKAKEIQTIYKRMRHFDKPLTSTAPQPHPLPAVTTRQILHVKAKA